MMQIPDHAMSMSILFMAKSVLPGSLGSSAES
jgi:hypothetical protein